MPRPPCQLPPINSPVEVAAIDKIQNFSNLLGETLGSVTSLDEFCVSIPDGVSDFDCSTPGACVASTTGSCDWVACVGFNRLNSKLSV